MKKKSIVWLTALAVLAVVMMLSSVLVSANSEEKEETPFLPRTDIAEYDGDFEQGLEYWNVTHKSDVAVSEENYYAGKKSLHIERNSREDLTITAKNRLTLPPDAAGDYVFSCFVMSRGASIPKLYLNIDFFDAKGTLLITMNSYPQALNGGNTYTGWKELTNITTMPAGAVSARIKLKLTAGAADVFVDYITCTERTNTAFYEDFSAVSDQGTCGSWKKEGAIAYESKKLAAYGKAEASIRIENVQKDCIYLFSGRYSTTSENFKVIVTFYDLKGNVAGKTEHVLPKAADENFFEFSVTAPSCVYAELSLKSTDGVSSLDDILLYKSYDPSSAGFGWEAVWVWHDEDYQLDAQYQSRYYRTEFELESGVQSAVMQFSADDRIYLWINGVEVPRTGSWDSWDAVKIVDFAKYCKEGKNVIAAKIENDNSYGGYLLDATIMLDTGKEYRVVTNSATTVSSKDESPNWYAQDFDDTQWSATVEHGSVPVQPWGALAYTNASAMGAEVSLTDIEVTPEVKTGGTVELSMTVVPGRDVGRDLSLSGTLWVRNTLNEVCEVFLRQVSGPPSSQWKEGGRYNVTYAFTVPDYIDAATYQLQLDLDQLIVTDMEILNNRICNFKVKPGGSEHLITSEVKQINGVTRLLIDGEVTAPMIFLRGDRDQQWSPRYGQNLTESGVKLVATQNMLDGSVGTPVWTDDGVYDFTAFDEMAYKTLNGQPDALLMMQVDCNTPTWWQEKYPDECVLSSDGTRGRMSFASEKWRTDVGAVLKALMAHLQEQPYSSHIYGIKVTAGSTFEWVHWGMSLDKNIDYSPAALSSWRKWLKEKYGTDQMLQDAWNKADVTLNTAEVPTRAERLTTKYNTLLDFETQRNVIDFHLFMADMNVESLLYFAKTIKEAIEDRWIVGTYYGYLTTVYTYEANGTAHMGLKKAVASPYLDFFCGPMNYGERGSGESASWMSLVNGILNHGKLFIMECDNRTAFYDTPELPETAGNHGQTYTVHDTVQQMIRDYAQVITKGAGLWWYDMHGGNFDYEEIYRLFSIMQTEWDYEVNRYSKSTAEVAIFVDDDLYAYTPYNFRGTYDLFYNMQYGQRRTLSAAGIPFDLYLVSDLEAGVVPEYNINMIYTVSLDRKEREAIDKQLKRDGKTVIWMGLPGIYDDEEMSASNIADATGINVELTTVAYSYAVKVFETDHFAAAGAAGTVYGEPNQYNYVSPIALVKDEKAVSLGGLIQDASLIGLAYKDMGDWNSIFSSVPNIPAQVFVNLINEYGGHLYIEGDASDVIFASSGYVGINSPFGGKKVINLPQSASVYDVFNGKYISFNATSFEIIMEEDETRLFRLDTPDYVTIKISHGYGGKTEVNGFVKASIGSRKIFRFTPDDGYRVSYVTLDGEPIAFENNVCVISDIADGHELYVAFEKSAGTPSDEKPKNLGLILGLSIGGAAVIAAACATIFIFAKKKRGRK